jgi:phosphatidylglycerol---prolipoprotein diacylglyceryl transferase
LFPVLTTLHFGGREIALRSYGIMIAIGLAAGISLAYRRARDAGLDGGRFLDAAFWITVGGLVGSRVAYVAVNAGDYARACFVGPGMPRGLGAVLADCSKAFQIWEGGLVFYGGVLGAALVGVWFARREDWPFLKLADVSAPALALGHAFGRLGCLAAGCCFGKEASAAWGVPFWRGSVAYDDLVSVGAVASSSMSTPPLHATQLYEAVGEIAIFFALIVFVQNPERVPNLPRSAPRGEASLRARDHGQRLRRRPGRTFLVYVTAYAALRFVVEMFRGDVGRGYAVAFDTPGLAEALHLSGDEPIFLSVGQLSSVLVLLAVVIWAWRASRDRSRRA